MRIKQILNNNVVSSLDSNGVEVILTGKALGFNASVGDEVNVAHVEKTFHLHDDKVNDRFKVLLNEVPVEIIQLTDDIVNLARSSLNYPLSEIIYVSLADHLNFAIQRNKNGMDLVSPLQWEVKHFYRKEYLVGHQALAIIASYTGLLLPDSEACSIALHIVNSGMQAPDGQIIEITKLIHQIQSIVKYWFGITFDEQGIAWQRFITHVKFFAQRVIGGIIIENDDDDLFEFSNNKHEKAYSCVNAIGEFTKKNYGHVMTNSEKLYLTVHIYNIVKRHTTSI
ncbi:PRD domain-containing protein [Erwinia sp. S43]|uniref:BglG family transcription antiterminator LicT n=1 Tax=unclassified Erwinia TaxID=2622719 RepID=UPI00190BBF39|nr:MULTISPECIES: PRD domain-containing protein [unclassified Erwinia]MBK0001563.1 PRD domain-containing protein [Erwinia sp. S38]MBK0035056.1 PRD domain-containing protein [Erwinia sp. S43]MCW1875351.1 PRD domain-containing protein [Erwinia sp. INIA01]